MLPRRGAEPSIAGTYVSPPRRPGSCARRGRGGRASGTLPAVPDICWEEGFGPS